MNQRNTEIIQARAAGRPLQAIALEHGLSVARVCTIVQDHKKDLRIAELEAVLRRIIDEFDPEHHDFDPIPRLARRALGQ